MKRFCPGCAQRKLQMNAAPCEICGRVDEITPPRPREKMHVSARMMRALLQPLGRFFHALTFIFCGFALWAMALHWILPFFGFVQNGLLLSGLIAGAVWMIRFTTRGAVWLLAPATRKTTRPGARSFLILPICALTLWSLNRFDAPLRVAFLINRPALEKLANGVPISGMSPYFVKRMNVDATTGSKRFEVTDNDFIWSGTKAGFAKCPGGCGSAKFPPAYMRSEAPKYLKLWNDWFWWEESGTDD